MRVKRIDKYLQARLGKRGQNRSGLARLIEEYPYWTDPDESSVDSVLKFAKNEGFTKKTRKGYVFDNRQYLYVYLFCIHNVRPSEMARKFDFNHGTILSAINVFEARINDHKFLERTAVARRKFPLDLRKAVVILEVKKGYGKQNSLDTNDLTDKELHLSLVRSLMRKDGLDGYLRGHPDKTWKRYFLFSELKKHGWSNQRIVDFFGLRTRTCAWQGLDMMNNPTLREKHREHLRRYEQLFKHIKI